MDDNPNRNDSEQDETAPMEVPELGRPVVVEPSPEGEMMQVGTLPIPGPAPAFEESRSPFEIIDDRAAAEARMEVHRHEHSADSH